MGIALYFAGMSIETGWVKLLEKKTGDLTQGGILQRLIFIAIPIMGTQFVQMTYNLVDTFWVGKLGEREVAATGTAGMFMWLSVGFMLIGRIGAEIGVSQNFGRGEIDLARKFSQNAIWISAVLGIFFAAMMIIFRNPLISFFNIPDPMVVADSALYLSVVAIGIPFTFVSSAIVGTFNASGNSKDSFVMMFAGLILNIILDPLLIFGFNMGILGAAVATIVSQIISCTIAVWYIHHAKKRPFEKFSLVLCPSAEHIKRILKWGVPIGLESALFTILAMITSRFEAGFGTQAMAVSRIGSQIESLTWMLGGGFGSALIAFIGQNYGAGKWHRIRRCFKMSLGIMTCYGITVALTLVFGARFLFSIFLSNPDTIELGRTYLIIMAISQIFMCIEGVASNMYKGIGKTLPPSIISFIANSIRVILAFFLSQTSLGVNGVWIAVSAAAVIRGAIMLVCYLISSRKQPKEDEPTQEPIAANS